MEHYDHFLLHAKPDNRPIRWDLVGALTLNFVIWIAVIVAVYVRAGGH